MKLNNAAVFEQAHEMFLEKHMQESRGERRKRLMEGGHGYAEKLFLSAVWWPAFGGMEHLYPEYEIRDFRDGYRFIDFAFLLGTIKVCIEVDGYGSHARDMNRRQFADQLMRQNHLVLDGWTVLRFAYDDIADKPRRCQQILLQMYGAMALTNKRTDQRGKLTIVEHEVLKFVLRTTQLMINSSMVAQEFGMRNKYAWQVLRRLKEKGFLVPAKEGAERIRTYRVFPGKQL